jgi:hypothetical protein
MKAALRIIVDVSGSMNEMGKIHLQRNLCRYAAQLQPIDQEEYADFDIRFCQWAQNVSEILLQGDGDIPPLDAEGSSNLSALSDVLSQRLDDTGRLRVLILFDCNFSDSNILSFRSQLSSFPDLIIRTVAVGADADLLKLKKISTNNSVHLSENIASAIDCTIFSTGARMAAPESTTQILQTEPGSPEEDWDA